METVKKKKMIIIFLPCNKKNIIFTFECFKNYKNDYKNNFLYTQI